MTTIIETERLILRTWRKEDTDPYFQINQDPQVMEYFPGLQDLETTKNFITKVNNHFDKHGYSLYATVRKDTNEFIGLFIADFEAHFTPATEIGWRLSSKHWGEGFATEGAKAALDYGFKKCSLKEIVSFTVPANVRSIRVMEKIGLKRDVNGDFAHPKLPAEHPLLQHILYRLTADEYLQGAIMTEKYCFTVGDDGQKSLDLLDITFNDQSKYFLNKHGLQQGMSVLDIGCGLGAMAQFIAEMVGDTGSVVAIDNSENQRYIQFSSATPY